MPQFNYSANLIVPVASSVSNSAIADEFSTVFDGLRTLAAHIDEVTGNTTFNPAVYSTIPAGAAILGTNLNRIHVLFPTAAPAGAMINLYNSAGVLNARLAQANSQTTVAHGFILNSVAAGSYGEIVLGGGLNTVGGLSPGVNYFLSATGAGQVAPGITTFPGFVYQPCGIAISTNLLFIAALNNWVPL
jgi:hypothetical protein